MSYKTNDETYQGYANWATWNLTLWFDNDEGLYNSYHDQGTNWDATQAESHAREYMPEGTPDMEGDEMDLVDWQEVADVWNQE